MSWDKIIITWIFGTGSSLLLFYYCGRYSEILLKEFPFEA